MELHSVSLRAIEFFQNTVTSSGVSKIFEKGGLQPQFQVVAIYLVKNFFQVVAKKKFFTLNKSRIS